MFSQDGKTRTAKVTREVIVSGGTVNSPQLLLLSGIGPKEQLETLGIPVVLDLPGVGKNLHNHVSYSIDFTINNTQTAKWDANTLSEYLINQTGPLSSSGLAQTTAILASKYTTPDDPDIQIFFSGFQATCGGNVDLDGDENNGIGIRFTAVNTHAKSRGKWCCVM